MIYLRQHLRACDDDQPGISHHPILIHKRIRAHGRRLNQMMHDIRLAELHGLPSLGLLAAPAYELVIFGRQEGDCSDDPEQPWCCRNHVHRRHASFQHWDGKMLLSFLEHVEGFAEGKVTHDVEGVVVEPLRGVELAATEGFDLVDEEVGVAGDAGFVVPKC